MHLMLNFSRNRNNYTYILDLLIPEMSRILFSELLLQVQLFKKMETTEQQKEGLLKQLDFKSTYSVTEVQILDEFVHYIAMIPLGIV